MISEGWRLFIDDEFVESRMGLERTWHQPVKHEANPVIRADQPWEGRCVYLFGTVMQSADGWQMWYQSYNPRVRTRDRTNVCLAVSRDGLCWSKPKLGIIDFQGSADNNIVLQKASDDAGSLYSPSVLVDPGDPTHPYRMFWHDSGWQMERRGKLYGVSAAYSKDGIEWIRYPENPIDLLSHDVLALIHDEKIGRFVAYTKTHFRGKRARARAETTDILTWPEPELMLHADDQDSPDTEIYWSVHQPYADLYVGLAGIYLTCPDTIHVEFIFSRDGRNWSRTRSIFLPFGAPGEFDSMMICAASPPLVDNGDELLLYYGGFDGPHGARAYAGGAKGEPDQYGAAIGIARLRKDGFASLDASGRGSLVTQPLKICADELLINADASRGNLAVEVLGPNGSAMPGFRTSGCRPIASDSTRHRVEWAGGKTFASLKGQRVSLRILMENARLFSLRA